MCTCIGTGAVPRSRTPGAMAVHRRCDTGDHHRRRTIHLGLRVLGSVLFVTLLVGATIPGAVCAGPPFLTDDPEPLAYRHTEAYVFSTVDKTSPLLAAQLLAVEVNVGAYPDVHLHLVVPLALAAPRDGRPAYGVGDLEVGVKYRFIQETDAWPQVGLFPLVELPSGESHRGLGNGRTWWKLPLWLQKSWGPWTTYGGAGYAINTAPGMRNYPYGGWLLQRQLSGSLTLGGELFTQGAPSDDGKPTTIANVGGSYGLGAGCHHCQLLFSVGHSLVGEAHTVGYLGLYWEFGAVGHGR